MSAPTLSSGALAAVPAAAVASFVVASLWGRVVTVKPPGDDWSSVDSPRVDQIVMAALLMLAITLGPAVAVGAIVGLSRRPWLALVMAPLAGLGVGGGIGSLLEIAEFRLLGLIGGAVAGVVFVRLELWARRFDWP